MDFKKTLLALLAIFCVVVSAGAVCAADVDISDEGGDDSQYCETDVSETNEINDELTDVPLVDSDYDLSEGANETTNETNDTTDDVAPAAAENTTTNTTAPHTMPATGNPIIALIGVTAVLGGYTILRRR